MKPMLPQANWYKQKLSSYSISSSMLQWNYVEWNDGEDLLYC